ncbi:hypothetical protein HGI30_15025 [Paenibacillus albicereus]|uniref:Uncharacterized protein n=1 Tax=Paenibacillus albicereus TaxID=2726185 RepID=A0A6H2GZB4_9BACL|nr:hypothetical protein [Paenibacillus albicereus]QJC52745.1 hypothetical protein HGI30_15025 [Paenibacillus albicereus]
MTKRIEDDKQYENSLTWLREKAKKLDDPLFGGPERDKLMRTYDYVADQAQRYRWRDAADAKG